MCSHTPAHLVNPAECRLRGDCVEEVRSCRRFVWLIQSGPGDRSAFDDGGAASSIRGSVLSVLARTTCAGEALIAVDRSVRRTRRIATGASAVLQRDRAAIGRSGAADSHADRWLLLRHPLGAAVVRGGAPQAGVSLVLWFGFLWLGRDAELAGPRARD